MRQTSQFGFMRAENRICLPPPRSWQARCVPLIRQAIMEGHKRIVVQAPTGAGKTGLAAMLFEGSINKGKRPMMVVPDLSLIEQSIRSFNRVGIHDIGVIQGRHERTDYTAQVQIASLQTLIRREIPEVHLLVVDEVHVQWAGLYKLLDSPEWANKIVIGLSATPWARGMGLHWTKLIIGATIGELIQEGILCDFQGYGPAEDVDLSKARVKAGEYVEADTSRIMSDTKIVADVVEMWHKYGCEDRAFMFCVDRAHAKAQADKFREAGIPFGYIDGTMSIEEREPVFGAFRDRSIKGIASVGCLSRGVDEDVRVIIDCKPTKSEMDYVQRIGRGLRIAPGKDKLLILSHAGNERMGLVTDIHHDTLDMHKPGDKEPSFQQDKKKEAHKCGKCHAIVPFGRSVCLVCGFVAKTPSKIDHAQGELVAFGSKSKPKPSREERQQFYSEMLGLAEERGKSRGWAAFRHKQKYGDWPRGLSEIPIEPSATARNYDKSRRLAYAKGMAKANG